MARLTLPLFNFGTVILIILTALTLTATWVYETRGRSLGGPNNPITQASRSTDTNGIVQ
jgi:hypothetical protein